MHNKLVVITVALGAILLPLALVYLLFALPTPHSYIDVTATSTPTPHVMQATTTLDTATVISQWYAPLIPVTLGEVSLQASIADTEPEREQGLSDTPYLPAGVVKLFVFDTSAPWAFWMKDMQYPIDIIWLDEQKTVIHIADNLAPETYPTAFSPTVPARYVIETAAGVTTKMHLRVGAKATW